MLLVRVPGVHEHRDMMIPVKEDHWTLSQYDKERITKLDHLRVVYFFFK